MVHYRIHSRSPAEPLLIQITPVHAFPSHFLNIHINIILPSSPTSSKWPLTMGSPHKNLVCTSHSPIRAACPAHLIRLDLMTPVIFGEEYRSWSSSVCSLLHSPVTSSLLGPNIFLRALFWNTISLCFSFGVSDQVSHSQIIHCYSQTLQEGVK